jgi:hypothetical protein
MGPLTLVRAHREHPHPQAGGGAKNPPPPIEQSSPAGLSQHSQGNGSPSLLSPTSLEGDRGFKITTVAGGLRTTPPHAAVPRPVAPSPTVTKNSFAAFFPPDSPPAPADTAVEQTAVDQPKNSWTATLAHLDETDRILRSAVAKLTANAATTERLTAKLLSHKTLLDGIHNRVRDQSRVLGKITNANVARDAHLTAINDSIAVGVDRVKAVECRLTNVDEAITKFEDRLTSIHKCTETTTSSLCTEISDVRDRVIPDLRRDINREIHAALARFPLDTATDVSASMANDPTEGANVPTATTATAKPMHYLCSRCKGCLIFMGG